MFWGEDHFSGIRTFWTAFGPLKGNLAHWIRVHTHILDSFWPIPQEDLIFDLDKPLAWRVPGRPWAPSPWAAEALLGVSTLLPGPRGAAAERPPAAPRRARGHGGGAGRLLGKNQRERPKTMAYLLKNTFFSTFCVTWALCL